MSGLLVAMEDLDCETGNSCFARKSLVTRSSAAGCKGSVQNLTERGVPIKKPSLKQPDHHAHRVERLFAEAPRLD